MLHVGRISMFLFLMSVVTPEPQDLEGEEKGVVAIGSSRSSFP